MRILAFLLLIAIVAVTLIVANIFAQMLQQDMCKDCHLKDECKKKKGPFYVPPCMRGNQPGAGMAG